MPPRLFSSLTFSMPAALRGLLAAGCCVYNRRFSQRPIESCLTMEINPILNSIKDLSERTQSIRGYL